MGLLLQGMGQLVQARQLLEETLQACRELLGDRHPKTMVSIDLLACLLEEQGNLAEAIPLFSEDLAEKVSLHGMKHKETRASARHIVKLLRKTGQRDEGKALAAKHGV